MAASQAQLADSTELLGRSSAGPGVVGGAVVPGRRDVPADGGAVGLGVVVRRAPAPEPAA
ncbi:hypothetical protein [Kitasatospora sp. NPDC048407]|uniref:hypothetical protein n=1 Tax=Kitasatospora sp. NPDC048407 TaxID=3364051 RepID=UPI00371FD50E